ncbi:ROK family protein [Flammeovirga aprica]|uniref:ROK family protein n=1 Tax=Flammeovirga aprica JL-4 TaxID=694437 RepID=A0A7X9RSB1_9BACT|nr:ROK family protein [Flammeovirga aprica]NME66811.1 ROK family protein [Flammeovirga aprica JL-4]
MKTTIGIDLGGTHIKYALINEEGEIIKNGLLPSQAHVSAQQILSNIQKAIEVCLSSAKEDENEVIGIGVGTPGIVDTDKGIVLGGAENLKNWKNIPLKDNLEAVFNLPVFVDNDANMMAWGEHGFGAGKEVKDAVYLTIGTGIGGAIIVQNTMLRGSFFAGGELGMMYLNANKFTSNENIKGYWEDFASTSALVDDYKYLLRKNRKPTLSIDGKKIAEDFLSGDEDAIAVVQRHFEYIGMGIASLIHIMNPKKIIIGGGISQAGSFYLEGIQEQVAQLTYPICAENVEVCTASLGNAAGCLGAGYTAFKNLKSDVVSV